MTLPPLLTQSATGSDEFDELVPASAVSVTSQPYQSARDVAQDHVYRRVSNLTQLIEGMPPLNRPAGGSSPVEAIRENFSSRSK